MNYRILCALVSAALSSAALAQSGTNSPYSQYGLGQLAEQTSGFNRGMNGLGIGMREHNQVNFLNPASYSSIDSLSFIFDAGLSGQVTNFSENGVKKNANNADFEYVVAAFRAFKHVGLSFGLLPFTNVGYNYSATGYVDGDKTTTYTNTYSGTGGLHQVYLGLGWEPFRGFSLGGNFSYLWGEYSRSVVNAYSESTVSTLSKDYAATVRSYRLDLGAQYVLPLGKSDKVNLGVTYGLGHKLGADPTCTITSTNSTNSQASVSSTVTYTAENSLELPAMLGAGLVWNHRNSLKLGADYSLQQWGSVVFPEYSEAGGTTQYAGVSNYFKDRHKFTLGGEFCKNENGRRFLQRIHFRAGASYATPYLQINGQDGPRELSVSAGFGIPIINAYNNRSMLNISGQWAQQTADGLIRENTFRINIGITFNERWFMKWKVD